MNDINSKEKKRPSIQSEVNVTCQIFKYEIGNYQYFKIKEIIT